jgi:hypothetical protein
MLSAQNATFTCKENAIDVMEPLKKTIEMRLKTMMDASAF